MTTTGTDKPKGLLSQELSHEDRFTAWLQANAKAVGIGAGVVALVVAGTWFMSMYKVRKEASARTQLEQAWGAADAGNVAQASAELQKVVDAYAGTQAAFAARLTLNQTRLSAGQTQLAVDDLAELIQSNPPAQVRAQAGMLLGGALENLGKSAEAAAAYEAAAGAAEMDYAKGEALLGAARAWRAAGQNEKAAVALRTILEKYPETGAHSVAEVRLGEVLKGS